MVENRDSMNFNFIMHPGNTLKDMLKDKEMTPEDLAEKIDVSLNTVKKIIRGEKNISAALANKLECVFEMPACFWISLQKSYNKRLKEYLKNQE